MNRIYINTRQLEERRIVIVENDSLVGFEQDITGWENKKGDIYKAVVTRIEEGLDAAFVNFGESKNGFLPLKHIYSDSPGDGKNKIAEGDSILVQIKKDHVGDKGAGMTTNISLAGCYLVLMPGQRQKTLVSKNLNGRERQQILETLEQLTIPEGMGVIVRTAGIGRSVEDLRWDLESYLLRLWAAIESAAKANKGPILIYRENNLLLRAVRDYFTPGEDEIYCDDAESYQEVKSFVSLISPAHADCVVYHDVDSPMVPDLIEQQIDTIYERNVKTSSGGQVVFDITEAMVTVDVNSAQMRGHSDIEETALRANMEAAEIITRHMRLRDLGGLIVIDFIDMGIEKNRRKLEEYFIKLLRKDRARVQWTPLSRFGLMEISRQRLSRPVEESQSVICHACHGSGRQRRPESFALRLLRQIRTNLQQGQDVGALVAQVPTDTAVYMLNEKRVELRRLEDEYECEILIAPAADMHPPDFSIRKIKKDDSVNVSYEAVSVDNTNQADSMRRRFEKKQSSTPPAVIKTIMPEERAISAKTGIVGKFWQSLRGLFVSSPAKSNKPKQTLPPQESKPRYNRPKKQFTNSPIESSAATPDSSLEKKKRNSRRRPIRRNKTAAEQAVKEPLKELSSAAESSAQSPADKTDTPILPTADKTVLNTAATVTKTSPAMAKTSNAKTDAAPSNVAKSGVKSDDAAKSKAQPSTKPATTATTKPAKTTAKTVAANNSGKNINQAEDSTPAKSVKAESSDAQNSPSSEVAVDEYVKTPSLLSRLAVQHGKSEIDIKAGLSALGCDINMVVAANSEITVDIEKRLTEYFQPSPLIIEEDSGLIMVETAAEITSNENTRGKLGEEVRILTPTDSKPHTPSAELTTMKQVETSAADKNS